MKCISSCWAMGGIISISMDVWTGVTYYVEMSQTPGIKRELGWRWVAKQLTEEAGGVCGSK